MSTPLRALVSLVIGLSAASFVHAAIPRCTDAVKPVVVLQGQGMLEAILFDADGRMLLSNLSDNTVHVLPQRDAQPTVLFKDIANPGGLALGNAHDLYVGTGNSPKGVLPSLRSAGIIRIDLSTGQRMTYATGLTMSNGVRRAADGTLYASNDLSKSLDRVRPDGQVDIAWLKQNSNGMAFSADGQTLFVNQTFPARVMAVDLRTDQVRVYAQPTGLDTLAAFDGMTIDPHGNLLVAAYTQGKVLRVSPTGAMCTLTSGLFLPTDLAIGTGLNGFTEGHVYVTSHGGKLYELPGVGR